MLDRIMDAIGIFSPVLLVLAVAGGFLWQTRPGR